MDFQLDNLIFQRYNGRCCGSIIYRYAYNRVKVLRYLEHAVLQYDKAVSKLTKNKQLLKEQTTKNSYVNGGLVLIGNNHLNVPGDLAPLPVNALLYQRKDD